MKEEINYNIVQINFLIGLPASGKTITALNNCKNYGEIGRIDYESLQLKGFRHFKKETLKSKLPWLELGKLRTIYLDGLFLDIVYIKEIIEKFRDIGFKNFGFTIIEPNIESCIRNDLFRRGDERYNEKEERWESKILSSANSILKIKLPVSDIIDLCSQNGYVYEIKPCYRKGDKEIFRDWLRMNGIKNEQVVSYQKSKHPDIPKNLLCVFVWCSGGKAVDYRDNVTKLKGNCNKPRNIKNINIVKLFLRYDIPLPELNKIIYKYEKDFLVSDYYGGAERNSILVVDIDKLFELFKFYTKLDWEKINQLDFTIKK